MTARDFIARLQIRFAGSSLPQREVLLIARLIFQEMADFVYISRLATGQPLTHCDPIGFKEWIEELAEAARVSPVRVTPIAGFCPDCGHVHLDESECAFPIGGERTCRCERKVSA